jgi:hypothetical protein
VIHLVADHSPYSGGGRGCLHIADDGREPVQMFSASEDLRGWTYRCTTEWVNAQVSREVNATDSTTHRCDGLSSVVAMVASRHGTYLQTDAHAACVCKTKTSVRGSIEIGTHNQAHVAQNYQFNNFVLGPKSVSHHRFPVAQPVLVEQCLIPAAVAA